MLVARVLAALVALEHFYFFVLECFLWNTPFGRRTFGTTPEFAAVDGADDGQPGRLQRLPRGRPRARPAARRARRRQLFVLGCVVLAGVVGAATVKRSILLVQALPAALAIGAFLAATR